MKKLILLFAILGMSLANAQHCPDVEKASRLWASNIGKNGITKVQYNCNDRTVIVHQNQNSKTEPGWFMSKAFKYGYLKDKSSKYFEYLYNNEINEIYVWYWKGERVYEFQIDYDEFN